MLSPALLDRIADQLQAMGVAEGEYTLEVHWWPRAQNAWIEASATAAGVGSKVTDAGVADQVAALLSGSLDPPAKG